MNAQDLVSPVADDIRNAAGAIEEARCLPTPLMERLVDAGLFSIYTPRMFGGLELPLPEALHVVEAVATIDGSTGWTVALGVMNDLFTCSLPEDSATRILRNGSALLAGAPGFNVRALAVDGGYRLTGQWSYCSGAPNATWMSVVAPVYDGEEQRMGPHGPAMIGAVMPPADVEIVDTWHVSGLRGTGTQDLRVQELFVPTEMTGSFGIPAGPQALRPSVLARIPFLTMLCIAQSPSVCLGIARHAIDEFRSFAMQKERPMAPRPSEQVQTHVGLARAEALLRSARAYWYEAVEQIWDTVSREGEVSLQDRTAVRLAALTAAEHSTQAVDLLHRLTGASVIFQTSPIDRCWRDIHAAAQHMHVQDSRWETAGRVLLGLDPMSPFV